MLDQATRLVEDEKASEAQSLLASIQPSHLPLFAQAEYYERVGHAHGLLGQFRPSRHFLLKALQIYRAIHDSPGQWAVQLKLGDVERQMENFPSARNRYQSVPRHAPSSAYLDAQLGVALSWKGMGHYRKAEQILVRLLNRYKKNHDRTGVATAHWALATTYRFMGNLTQADEHARASITQYAFCRDEGGMAYALCARGGIQRMRGLALESGKNYGRASKIFRRLKDQFGLAYSSCGIGNSYRMRGLYSPARLYSRRAGKIYQALKLKGPLAFVWWNLAQIDIAEKKFPSAEKHLSHAEKLFREVHDQRGLVYTQLGQGELKRAQQSRQALRFYRRAQKMAKSLGLQLEYLHAKGRLRGLTDVQDAYQSRGVKIKQFQSYSALP